MNFIDEFRDKENILALKKLIEQELKDPTNIMEIRGGHTHSIMKYALPSISPEEISFIHGPGCPVCVIPRVRIDIAIKLASMKDTIFCTLGDLLRMPGSEISSLDLRAKGADAKALYSPFKVLEIARQNLNKNIILFAIGFGTTTSMSALLLQKIIEEKINNVFFHINHITVPTPVEAIMNDENVKTNAFLGPSHVSVITGYGIYEPLAAKFKTPIAVSGFEPVNILESVLNIIKQSDEGTFKVYNQYKEAVSKEGNVGAQNLVKKYSRVCGLEFHGLGLVRDGGLELKEEFSAYDTSKKFDCTVQNKNKNKACICGQILRGLAKSYDYKVFGKACTPGSPIGSCMVSGEGVCAAYYRHSKVNV